MRDHDLGSGSSSKPMSTRERSNRTTGSDRLSSFWSLETCEDDPGFALDVVVGVPGEDGAKEKSTGSSMWDNPGSHPNGPLKEVAINLDTIQPVTASD